LNNYLLIPNKNCIVQIVIAYNKVSFQVISKTLGLAKIDDDDDENHQHYRDDIKIRGTQVSSQTQGHLRFFLPTSHVLQRSGSCA
jgi:hypothetical protein